MISATLDYTSTIMKPHSATKGLPKMPTSQRVRMEDAFGMTIFKYEPSPRHVISDVCPSGIILLWR